MTGSFNVGVYSALAGNDHTSIRYSLAALVRWVSMQQSIRERFNIKQSVGKNGERGNAVLDVDIVSRVRKMVGHEPGLVLYEPSFSSARLGESRLDEL